MIGDILPASVAAVERFADLSGVALFPEEEAVIRNAVSKRRREFATVRQCAREALRSIGVPPAALLPGARGAPGWPPGVVGSMTHCAGYRAAAVALARDLEGIGIDAEPDQPLPPGVLDLVTNAAERAHLDSLAASASPCWDRLLFCAKEALYKAWYPLTQRWLDFSDAVVTIGTEGTFSASVLVPGVRLGAHTVTDFDGRWLARSGLLLACVIVHPAGRPDGAGAHSGLIAI